MIKKITTPGSLIIAGMLMFSSTASAAAVPSPALQELLCLVITNPPTCVVKCNDSDGTTWGCPASICTTFYPDVPREVLENECNIIDPSPDLLFLE